MEMNTRERFLEVMNFNTDVRPPKWELGFWGENINQWYEEGMPEKYGTNLPTNIITTSSSLYTFIWTYDWRKKRTYLEKFFGERERKIPVPKGIAAWGGFLYWPSQGFPLALDVMDYFGFDKSTSLIPVEQFLYPRFEPKILEENEKHVTYLDIDGVTRIFHKDTEVMPYSKEYPIKDRSTWLKVKDERMRLDTISQRFPKNWSEWVKEYKNRDYVLAVGGYPLGFFGTLVNFIGYENVFRLYYDDPDLIKDILQHLTTLWISIWEEVMSQVEIDCAHFWEDMCDTRGPIISPNTFKEFMSPCYKRITDFLKGKGVKVILMDCDGNVNKLIPLILEAGVTGLYPMETKAGMDVVKVRKNYPKLQMGGGVPKHDIALGKKRIDEILEPINATLDLGGYIPFGDHAIPPEVSWEQFKYYRNRLNNFIDSKGEI